MSGSSMHRAAPARRNGNKPQSWEESECANSASHVSAVVGPTLLPKPVASLVSLLTHSTSLSLRLGTYFGGAAIDGARVTTLTGLELSRGVIEGILTRAARDVVGRFRGKDGRANAESLLERSLATLHSTVTSASFFVSASFHLSSAALSSISSVSQNLLSTLDAILGSTESSRAIAAIIKLIRRELANNGASSETDKVGVGDLLVGTIGFALLQRWGRRNTERKLRESDEIIWDVVILDNGVRTDVIGTGIAERTRSVHDSLDAESARSASFLAPRGDNDIFDAMERGPDSLPAITALHLQTEAHHRLSVEEIRRYIMRQLPPGTRASIRTELLTAHAVTVDIFDDDITEIIPPPGMMMVEERFHHDQNSTSAHYLPGHTMVFRTDFNPSYNGGLHALSDPPVLLSSRCGNDLKISSAESTRSSVYTDSSNGLSAQDDQLTHSHADPNTTSTMSLLRTKATDRVHTVPRTQSPYDNSVEPQSSEPTEREQPRHTLSLSSLSGPKTPKPTSGKISLATIARRVKPTFGKKRKYGMKFALKKVPRKFSGISIPKGASKAKEGEKRVLPCWESKPRIQSTKLNSKLKWIPVHRNSAPQTIPPIIYSGPPKAPSQDTSRQKPTSSPVTANGHLRGVRSYASSKTDIFPRSEKNADSFIPRTDSCSVHAVGMRPGSTSFSRIPRFCSSSRMSRTRPEDINTPDDGDPYDSSALYKFKTLSPSIYSLATARSETSLVLAARPRKGTFEDQSTIIGLNRDGRAPGLFPNDHLVRNIRRFCRFSSASYGPNALKVMGNRETIKSVQLNDGDNHEHSSFSNHTGLPPSTILLSSFADPVRGSDTAGDTVHGFPLVHYLALDHESKAVVLTLRGTWGFEDILTDMTCDYDDLEWQGKNWKVHKGMHASARRLLEGGSGKVLEAMKSALEEFDDYGVVLCGHSLGGGVASLLATMISEPDNNPLGPSFVTAPFLSAAQPLELTPSHQERAARTLSLPPGRAIHAYTYGPPAVMSPFLRRATRGLITTIVNENDVVPSLSLGTLHDLRSVSLAFMDDATGTKSHIRSHIWRNFRSILNRISINQLPIPLSSAEALDDDSWTLPALQSLRAEMLAPKLMPPGNVFVVETMRVLQRNAFTPGAAGDGYPSLGGPATRVQFRFIRNVEAWFGELRFGSGMLGNHNPVSYEASLVALMRGVLDD